MRRLFALAVLVLAGSALATSHFVYDNLPTPGNKTQRRPSVNPSQELSATETNGIFQALRDLRSAHNDAVTMFQVQRYGAKCDGTNDDTEAIQAAIDAAHAYQLSTSLRPTVQFPRGVCKQSKPLFMYQAIALTGYGKTESELYPFSSFRGYNIIMARDASTGPGPAGTGAFAVPGQMTWAPLGSFDENQYYYDLAQVDQGRIPKDTSWTLYFRFKPSDLSQIYQLWGIQGNLWPNQYNPAMNILWFPGTPGSFGVGVRYNGMDCFQFASFASPPNMVNGVEHAFEVSYDQSAKVFRFFVDGQKWTNGDVTVTSGCGGARSSSDGSGMMEFPWEAHPLGPSSPCSAVQNTPCNTNLPGTLRDFWFSSTVRHTSSHTPPAAGTISSLQDGNTLMILTFDRFYKGAIVGDWGTPGFDQHVYLYPELNTAVEMPQITLKDFTIFTGGGIKGDFNSALLVENVLQFGAQDGWRFDHNGYFSRFKNVDVVASGGRTGFHNSGGSYIVVDNSTFSNRVDMDLNGANIFGTGNSFTVHPDCLAGLIITGGGVTDFTGLSIDAEESSSVPWLGAVVINNNNTSVTLRTPTLYGPTNRRTTDPVIQIHIDHEDTGPVRILIEEPYFAAPPSAGPIVLNNLSFSSGTQNWAHPVIIENATYLSTPFSLSGTYDQVANTYIDTPGNVLDLSPTREQLNDRPCRGPPDAGHWFQGNLCWNSNPTPGGFVGWINVDAGSPGVWKGFGGIAP